MEGLFALLVVAGAAWFWYDTRGVGEIAHRVCKTMCLELNLQLLDGTVSLRKVWLGRNPEDQLRIRRFYSFDYSGTGYDRRTGVLVLLASTPEWLQIQGEDGWEHIPIGRRTLRF